MLVVYDRGVPPGRVITNSTKAANHIFLIQKKQLIQGEICLFINAFTHHQDQRSYVSKDQLFLLQLICSGLTFCRNTAFSRRPYQLAAPSLVLLLGHHPDHFQCHLSLIRRYHVPSLKNPEESKVLIGLVESSCLSGFWRHI